MTRIANGTARRIVPMFMMLAVAALGSGCAATVASPEDANGLPQARKPAPMEEQVHCVDAVGGCSEPIVIRQNAIFIAQPPIRIRQPPIRVKQAPIRVRNRPIVIEQPRVVLAPPKIDMDRPAVHVEKPQVIVERPDITVRPATPCEGPDCGIQKINVRQPVMAPDAMKVSPEGGAFIQKGGAFFQKR